MTYPPSASASTSRKVSKAVYATEQSEGVGARVRRSIGTSELRNLSPFLMLDHFTIGLGAGFADHPHRGQTTVTLLLEGMMEHEDFCGNRGFLEPGDVQWMTAGKGIVHAEMPYYDPVSDPEKKVKPTGMQLWIDLPKEKKFIEPSYQEKKAKDMPTVRPSDGVEITLISGQSHGAEGFVRPVGGCWYLDIKLSKRGARVYQPLPEGWTAFVYIIKGRVSVGEDQKVYEKYHTLVLSSTAGEEGVILSQPDKVDVEREEEAEETRLVLIAGEPLDQPVVQYGPFVLNTQRQAMEAVIDFRSARNGFERRVGWESEIGQALGG